MFQSILYLFNVTRSSYFETWNVFSIHCMLFIFEHLHPADCLQIKVFYDDMRKVLRVIMNPHCTTQWTQCDITNQTTGAWSYWKLVTFIQREFNQIHHWQFYDSAITGEQYGTGLSITINQSYSDGFNLNRISIKPINSIIVSPDGWVFGWQSVWLPLTSPLFLRWHTLSSSPFVEPLELDFKFQLPHGNHVQKSTPFCHAFVAFGKSNSTLAPVPQHRASGAVSSAKCNCEYLPVAPVRTSTLDWLK